MDPKKVSSIFNNGILPFSSLVYYIKTIWGTLTIFREGIILESQII